MVLETFRLLQGRHVVGEDHGAAAEGHHGGQGLSFCQRHLDPRHLLKKCQFFCAVNFLMELGPIGAGFGAGFLMELGPEIMNGT